MTIPTPLDRDAVLPRRDAGARTQLLEVARVGRPVTNAGERLLAVPGDLGALLPSGGIPRGAVVHIGGQAPRHVALALAAAATTLTEWAVLVDDDVGGLAAFEAGVDPQRFAVVRDVPAKRWTSVVAALIEGVALVLATVPVGLSTGDARRLGARARERGTALAVLGSWPAEAAFRITVDDVDWGIADRLPEAVTSISTQGAHDGEPPSWRVPPAAQLPVGGCLQTPTLHVRVEGRTAPTSGRVALVG